MRILDRDLDDEQLGIARDADHSLLVIAGPGSGKTRLLTSLAAYQVRRSHPAPWRVLCLTFSVEAARQMRTRLDSRDLEVPSRRRIEIGNFHSFALELLGHHGHHVGWPRDAQVIDVLEAHEIAKEVADGLGLNALSGAHAYEVIGRLRNKRAADVAVPRESLARLRTYCRRPCGRGSNGEAASAKSGGRSRGCVNELAMANCVITFGVIVRQGAGRSRSCGRAGNSNGTA
jgi:UvrD/REP helicase N-terminal domain